MAEKNKALEPIEVRDVDFYEDTLTAVLVDVEQGQSQVFVPVKPLSDALGLSWSGQYERLQRDAVLSEETEKITISREGDQAREMVCLPLDYVNGWLFSINANRVKAEIRERLIRYQRECYQILARAFVDRGELAEQETTGEMQALARIREMGLAIAAMAEQQMVLTSRLDKAAIVVGKHGKRIAALERRLAPPQAIADEQATEIAQKVKALAVQLSEQEPGKNHFQGIFSELHRRFGVSSYKNIRQGQYHDVLAFLQEWSEANQPSE